MMRLLLAATLLSAGPTAPAWAAAPASPAGLETYTLDDAVRLALRNDAELQSADQDITIAQQRAREALLQFLPEVGLQASATRFDARYPFALRPALGSILLFPSLEDNFYSGQAYMLMSLYEGRRHVNTLRLAQAALKQAQSKYEAVKLDIVDNTKRVFHRLILAQESLAAAQEAAARLKELPEPAKPSGWERLEAESLAAEIRSAESEARHDVELARLDFLKGLNRELDVPVAVEGRLETRPVDVDLKQALVWATELRPELQVQTYKAQMDAISVNLSMGRRFPTVVLGMDYQVNGEKFPLNRNNWDATIGLKIPFSFDYWTQHTQKLAEQRQGEISRAELADRVHLQVRKAHKELQHWQEEFPVREREYKRVKELFDAAFKGAGLSPQSIAASLRVMRGRRRWLEAVTEHILARSRLERAIGKPLPES